MDSFSTLLSRAEEFILLCAALLAVPAFHIGRTLIGIASHEWKKSSMQNAIDQDQDSPQDKMGSSRKGVLEE